MMKSLVGIMWIVLVLISGKFDKSFPTIRQSRFAAIISSDKVNVDVDVLSRGLWASVDP